MYKMDTPNGRLPEENERYSAHQEIVERATDHRCEFATKKILDGRWKGWVLLIEPVTSRYGVLKKFLDHGLIFDSTAMKLLQSLTFLASTNVCV
jgi:hypothetical protein